MEDPLPGGKEFSHELELNRYYDMTKLGVYHIQFSCELPVQRSDPRRVKVVSNEITVTVLPK